MKKIFQLIIIVLITACPGISFAQDQGLLTSPSQPPADSASPAPATDAPAASSPSTGDPLEITADNSLEWQRNDKAFIARGNALAKQGDTSIAAGTLTASYEDKDGGGMKISKVSAEGNVIINSREAKAYGDKADYDLERGYALMTGGNLRMESLDQTVTARDRFEYHVAKGKLAAVGGAKAVRGQHTLEADTISATMKNNAKGQRVLDTLEAEGDVVITTPTEKITGASGIYRASDNKAELRGGIKIIRGPNILQGDRAEVDMTTNISRIFGGPSDGGRVKGVFYPKSQKKS